MHKSCCKEFKYQQFALFLMLGSVLMYTDVHAWTPTMYCVCLNNRFLVQSARLLWVWLEPLGDLSVWAMQIRNPSQFWVWVPEGHTLGPLNSWPCYALCFTLWTLNLKKMCTLRWECKDMHGKDVYFQKWTCCHIIVRQQSHCSRILMSGYGF